MPHDPYLLSDLLETVHDGHRRLLVDLGQRFQADLREVVLAGDLTEVNHGLGGRVDAEHAGAGRLVLLLAVVMVGDELRTRAQMVSMPVSLCGSLASTWSIAKHSLRSGAASR